MPVTPLPSVLREDFNDNLQQETWPEVYGAERGTLSGEPLKSGTALIFKGVGHLNTTLNTSNKPHREPPADAVDVTFVCRTACE